MTTCANDFHDATSDYLSIIPRFNIAIEYATANDNITKFYADYDTSIALLELTNADLALIIYNAIKDHDCDADFCTDD